LIWIKEQGKAGGQNLNETGILLPTFDLPSGARLLTPDELVNPPNGVHEAVAVMKEIDTGTAPTRKWSDFVDDKAANALRQSEGGGE
jgi:hypothetical protein